MSCIVPEANKLVMYIDGAITVFNRSLRMVGDV